MRNSLSRRLAALEEAYAATRLASSGAGGGGSDSFAAREFVSGVLAAIAHIRRAPIDRPPYGYETEKLPAASLEPIALAQYVAALTILRHPDEEEARAQLRLAQRGDEPVLWSLIDDVALHLGFSKGSSPG
jgi:hypothetical protein